MAKPTTYGRWLVLDRLGKGGQGEVFLALDTQRVAVDAAAIGLARACFEIRQGTTSGADIPKLSAQVRRALDTFADARDPTNMGALKLLIAPEGDDKLKKATGRFLRELRAYSDVHHPNLVRLLDANEDDHWCVTEYFHARELTRHQASFSGKAEAALQAFRGLVSGVAALHAKNIVHRDIKPDNVFFGSDNRLVLGDAGLAFYLEDDESRLSETLENVGSRDWMAPWLAGQRHEISPSADLFSLGKVLWWMLSGKPKLTFWDFKAEDEDNLEKLFPGDENMRRLNQLLDCVIVPREALLTIKTAEDLLTRVDEELQAIRGRVQKVTDEVRLCRVCGVGYYHKSDPLQAGLPNYTATKAFLCSNCGHVQFFRFASGTPPAWQK
jgi:serine/threonine protein kinase